jgi:hypothetical protein
MLNPFSVGLLRSVPQKMRFAMELPINLTPEQHAHGRAIAADPSAVAALNNLARVIRDIRLKRRLSHA